MKFNLPKEAQNILKKFKKANFQIFIVGGAVRDLLLEKEVTDWDFTTDAKPEEILKLFPKGFYDNKFGTVGVPVSAGPAASVSQVRPRSLRSSAVDARDLSSASPALPGYQIYEITTMRKEGDYKDHRHPTDVAWTNKIEEDLARRDFTINAIALSSTHVIAKSDENRTEAISKQEKDRHVATAPRDDGWVLTDPFNGQADLKSKLIRAVGNPSKRFQEDALRLIRAVRFASELEFEIDQKTFQAIKQNASLIKDVANERIRDELFKILASMNPYIGTIKLREAGILQIFLPELEKCFGIVQQGPKHDRVYDIGDHSLRTMRETPSSNPLVKFAALLHDIGKAPTFKKDAKGNVTFYNHEVVGAKLALKIAKRLNLSKKDADKLYRLIRWHMFTTDEKQTDSAIRRFIKNVGKENIEDMLALRIGDRLGGDTSKPVSWRMEKFQERIKQVLQKPFSITDLKVNGNDVMQVLNIPPGKKVGEILQKLFEEVLDDSLKNKREYLLDRIKKLA